jgi:hypothetical protein
MYAGEHAVDRQIWNSPAAPVLLDRHKVTLQ